MSANFKICRCPDAQRADALRVLHAGLPVDQQLGLVQSLQTVREQGDSVFDGLLIAVEADEIVAACWAQLTPGRTALVWLPDASSNAAVELMHALASFLDEHQISLAQFLASANDRVSADLLVAADLQRLAKLAYLAVEKELFPGVCPVLRLEFHPRASDKPDRLGNLLLRTYQDSLDCPRLNGVRTTGDVLEGYQQQGNFAPERWFFVEEQGQDVGALLLTAHADSGNWELVYMGLVPEARGNGFGSDILQFAMWQAKQGDADRLVLAVDEANQPALDTYQRAGFAAWDYRTVYARLRS